MLAMLLTQQDSVDHPAPRRERGRIPGLVHAPGYLPYRRWQDVRSPAGRPPRRRPRPPRWCSPIMAGGLGGSCSPGSASCAASARSSCAPTLRGGGLAPVTGSRGRRSMAHHLTSAFPSRTSRSARWAGQVAVQACPVPRKTMTFTVSFDGPRPAGRSGAAVPRPGFQLVDQRLLLLGRLDQRRPLRGARVGSRRPGRRYAAAGRRPSPGGGNRSCAAVGVAWHEVLRRCPAEPPVSMTAAASSSRLRIGPAPALWHVPTMQDGNVMAPVHGRGDRDRARRPPYDSGAGDRVVSCSRSPAGPVPRAG